MRPQRVEIVIGSARCGTVFAFGVLVALAILSLGTLLSIFVAAVLALGLDPVVGALVKRGWSRGRAALVVFAALFAWVFALVLVTAGPVWDQIVEFVQRCRTTGTTSSRRTGSRASRAPRAPTTRSRDALKDLAAGLPEAASRCSASPAACSVGAVAGDADVPGAVPADGAPDDHRLAVRVRAAGGRARWRPVLEDSIRRSPRR